MSTPRWRKIEQTARKSVDFHIVVETRAFTDGQVGNGVSLIAASDTGSFCSSEIEVQIWWQLKRKRGKKNTVHLYASENCCHSR